MASPIDICNRALSEIGSRGSLISSFNDPTNAAAQCQLWYDKLRRGLLRSAPWGFARSQAMLTQLGDAFPDNTAPFPFLYKYAYPADCIKLRYILFQPPQITNSVAPAVGLPVGGLPWLKPSRANRFLIANDPVEGKVILSNVCNAVAVYTGDIQNVDLFDDLFDLALTSALAMKLCTPITGNVGQKESFRGEVTDALAQARAADGTEALASTDHQPDWIAARGVNYPSGYPFGFLGANWGSWYSGYDTQGWGE